jgi:hypothetical protein
MTKSKLLKVLCWTNVVLLIIYLWVVHGLNPFEGLPKFGRW